MDICPIRTDSDYAAFSDMECDDLLFLIEEWVSLRRKSDPAHKRAAEICSAQIAENFALIRWLITSRRPQG